MSELEGIVERLRSGFLEGAEEILYAVQDILRLSQAEFVEDAPESELSPDYPTDLLLSDWE